MLFWTTVFFKKISEYLFFRLFAWDIEMCLLLNNLFYSVNEMQITLLHLRSLFKYYNRRNNNCKKI